MDQKLKQDLYKKAVDKYGKEAQFQMLKEEVIELSLAIQKHLYRKGSIEDVVSEAADVSIMIEQLSFILGKTRIVSDQKGWYTFEFLQEICLQAGLQLPTIVFDCDFKLPRMIVTGIGFLLDENMVKEQIEFKLNRLKKRLEATVESI